MTLKKTSRNTFSKNRSNIKKIEAEINETKKKADKLESETREIQNKIRLLL